VKISPISLDGIRLIDSNAFQDEYSLARQRDMTAARQSELRCFETAAKDVLRRKVSVYTRIRAMLCWLTGTCWNGAS